MRTLCAPLLARHVQGMYGYDLVRTCDGAMHCMSAYNVKYELGKITISHNFAVTCKCVALFGVPVLIAPSCTSVIAF